MKTGFIGCGKMAEAMISAMTASGVLKPAEILASDIDRNRLGLMKKRYGIGVVRDNKKVADETRTVFLAVKPQQMKDLLTEIAPIVSGNHLVISIAAGIKLSLIEAIIRNGRVVRMMPNLPCMISEGVSVYTMGAKTKKADRRTMKRLLSALGDAFEMSEARFDAVTALSGSGPAFFAYCLYSMVEGAVMEGLDRENALVIALQTMRGTASLLQKQGTDPRELMAHVASSRGTTAEGLAALDGAGASRLLQKAVRAAARRSREISQGIH